MTRVFALVIIAIVLLASVPKPCISAASTAGVKVGIYYYVWYGNGNTGLGTAHWNDSNVTEVVDTPDMGFYDSNSNVTLYNQLEQMIAIHIDFVLISWFGPRNHTEPANNFIDDNAQKVFQVIKDNNLSIQAALLFDAFNQSSGVFNFPFIYDYIYDTFVTPFQNIYFHFLDKPLLVIFNNPNPLEMEHIPKMSGSQPEYLGIKTMLTGFTRPSISHLLCPSPTLSEVNLCAKMKKSMFAQDSMTVIFNVILIIH